MFFFFFVTVQVKDIPKMTSSADLVVETKEKDYKLLFITKVNGVIPIHKYKSKSKLGF